MAAMAARSQAASLQRMEIAPCDLYAVFDGAAERAQPDLEGAFTAGEGTGSKPTMSTRALQLVFDEEAVAKRSGRIDVFRCHGPANVRQVERCFLITRDKPEMPTRRRKHFKGTNQGNAILGVPLLGMDNMWQLPLARKKAVLGRNCIPIMPAASSSSDGEGTAADFGVEGDASAKARPNNNLYNVILGGVRCKHADSAHVRGPPPPPPPWFFGQRRRVGDDGKSREAEPVFFNEISGLVAEEIIDMAGACAIIDMTMGAGTWAIAAMLHGIAYLGVALTEAHRDEVLKHVKAEAAGERQHAHVQLLTIH